MPDDSGGVYTVPAGTLVNTGDTLLPSQHNPWALDMSTAMSNRFSKDGRAPATGNWNLNTFRITNLGAPVATNDAVTKTYVDGVFSVKNTNYLALPTDNKGTLRFTAAATLTLTGAATLGANWRINVIADGGSVVVDPNGAETINGIATLNVPNGSSCEIICDGSNFFTVFKPSAWEVIGVFNPSAVATLDITNLGSFKFLRASGILALGTSSFLYRTSTNNGSSYDSGASDYSQQSNVGIGSTNGAAFTSAASGSITTQTAATSISFETLITNWNVAGNCFLVSKNFTITGSQSSEIIGSKRNDNVARNALRFLVSSGTMTGTIILEGARG